MRKAGEASRDLWQKRLKRKKKWKDTRHMVRILLATTIAGCFAILFLMPIVLTITNSFMSSSEISANYGQVFATSDTGGKIVEFGGYLLPVQYGTGVIKEHMAVRTQAGLFYLKRIIGENI